MLARLRRRARGLQMAGSTMETALLVVVASAAACAGVLGIDEPNVDVVSSDAGGEAGPSSDSGSSSGGGHVDASSSSSGGSGSGGDSGAVPPSCAPGGNGMTNCGGDGSGSGTESCCTSLVVAAGSYSRTYANSGTGATGAADPATVSSFRLDKYLVTVGRFRQFVKAWNGGAGFEPPDGSGKHAHLNGGQGLASPGGASMYEPGWQSTDDGSVAPTDADLACSTNFAMWTPSPGAHESMPMNCVSWWEAFAFCIWDRGFLPSESEWEYAAAGGSEQREYPWGSASPGSGSQYAIFGCYYPDGSGGTCDLGPGNIARVGTATQGAGKWGQLDLGGSVWEWTLDLYATVYVDPCADCTYLGTGSSRSNRGGSYYAAATFMLPAQRASSTPGARDPGYGARCARAP